MTKVLIVDSDSNFLAKAQQTLSWHGLTVTVAESAQKALNLIWQETPQVIISDVELPQLSGWTLCRLIKGSPRHAHIPFIFLAEEIESNGAIKAFQLDADDYLPKSISFAELATRINKRARKASITPASQQASHLSGQLGRIRLAELLQFLALQGDTWAVTLTNGSAVGQVLMSRGVILQAVSSFLEGMPAFQDLLCWEKGLFTIEPLLENIRYEGIGQPLEKLLLELAAASDELARELTTLEAAAAGKLHNWPTAA